MPAGSSISSGPESVPPAAQRFTVAVEGVPVVGVLHLPYPLAAPSAAARQTSLVVACHGLGASKDSDKYLLLGRMLPEAGLALARFDFRGAGESGGSYRDATTATRIADLEAVLAHLATHPALTDRVGLLGSSMGGFVAWHVAHRRITAGITTRSAGTIRPDAAPLPVVTWNAPADIAALEAREMSEASGLGPALVAEVRSGRHAVAPTGVSHALVVQGERDEVVPPAQGHALFGRARDPRALHLIAGADHRLTETHHRRDAAERSRRWMLEYLGD
jgi:pimeloyl-ACP methyl ester carboxylesterase